MYILIARYIYMYAWLYIYINLTAQSRSWVSKISMIGHDGILVCNSHDARFYWVKMSLNCCTSNFMVGDAACSQHCHISHNEYVKIIGLILWYTIVFLPSLNSGITIMTNNDFNYNYYSYPNFEPFKSQLSFMIIIPCVNQLILSQLFTITTVTIFHHNILTNIITIIPKT